MNVISNEILNTEKIDRAKQIILSLQNELYNLIENDYGPFLAAVYDRNNQLIAKSANTVQLSNCSNNHAEINVIKAAQEKLGTYDLSQYDLSLYVSAEPCIMCLGAIMWSGIKNVYFGVPSDIVEKVTGFDEGFKPNWLDEFRKREIIVYGNIEVEAGQKVLQKYIEQGKKVYKPSR